MPKQASRRVTDDERYWSKRLRSPAFRRALTQVIRTELRAFAAEPIKDVLDARRVHRLLSDWDGAMVNQAVLADLAVHGYRRFQRRVQHRRESILEVLDTPLVAEIDALLEEDLELSADIEEFVATLMRQEFMRRLFTDIIFTSIASFYRRVNPLFGALTTRVLEEQIKSFIRLFLPAIQRQATAFALSEENQRILLDFTRSIVRQLLEEPLGQYAAMVSPRQQQKTEALIRTAVGNARLDAAVRTAMSAAWDDMYKTIGHRPVGEVVRLKEHSAWFAEQIVEMVLPALARPRVIRFVAAEMARATAQRR